MARHPMLRGFTMTAWGGRHGSIYNHTLAMRKRLEGAVIEVLGDGAGVEHVEHAADINAACRLEMLARFAETRINKGLVEDKELLSWIRVAADLISRRGVAIRRLGLSGVKAEEDGADEWAEVDGMRRVGAVDVGGEYADGGETISGETDEPKGDET